ncbi:MAG: glycogen synthase [Gammaproteobacteria bacterium]
MFVAAENGALPGGKVGGIGDVIHYLAIALGERGWDVTVVTPGYGVFQTLPGAQAVGDVSFPFAGDRHIAQLSSIPGAHKNVQHIAIEHELFAPHGPGQIYYDDGSDAPFATDAHKFAAFSSAAASFVLEADKQPDVVHLHDWHTACYLMLRAYDARFAALKNIPAVYTIHNLALQGTRPLRNHLSSLESWFPNLNFSHYQVSDPRYADCVNPMATAIRLADRVNTVSPTYAQEILKPNDPSVGFHGGEGLEEDLQTVEDEGRLIGVLNGCNYSDSSARKAAKPKVLARRPAWTGFQKLANRAIDAWMVKDLYVASSQLMARSRLASIPKRRPATLLTSIGRLTAQKVALFMATTSNGKTALENILDRLGNSGVFVLLGSGDRMLEQRMAQLSQRYDNFLFLCGYSEELSDFLFKSGDLFLMPSSFEPCGISQLFAMRAGQPCVVHAVGGLKDTVVDGHTGFVFSGKSVSEQADNFVSSVDQALTMKTDHPEEWRALRLKAAAQRFGWAVSAELYEREFYEPELSETEHDEH